MAPRAGDGVEMAGESAQREFERIRRRRKDVDRRWLPGIVGVALALAVVSYVVLERKLPGVGFVGPLLVVSLTTPFFGPTQREVAWRRGAEGERIVGAALDALRPAGFHVLHDRRMPRSRANLDHVAIAAHGVYTVDAKRYSGRLEVRRGRLTIAGRDRSKLLEQARRQQAAVRTALDRAGEHDLPVVSVLCFTGVEWPLLFRPRRVGDVLICSPRGLRRTLQADGNPGRSSGVTALADRLGAAFPPVLRPDGTPGSTTGGPRRTPHASRDQTVEGGDAVVALPRCDCGAAMVERRRRRDAEPFYGCSTFPSCRRTRPGA